MSYKDQGRTPSVYFLSSLWWINRYDDYENTFKHPTFLSDTPPSWTWGEPVALGETICSIVTFITLTVQIMVSLTGGLNVDIPYCKTVSGAWLAVIPVIWLI